MRKNKGFYTLVFINCHDIPFVSAYNSNSIVSLLILNLYILKKQNLTSLRLNKKAVSNFQSNQLKGAGVAVPTGQICVWLSWAGNCPK